MARLRPPPQPHFMAPSSLFPWAAGRTRPPWVSRRPQNGRDHRLVPGEQGQRPLAPPLHAHLPSAPAGPVRTRRPGVAVAGRSPQPWRAWCVHSGQGLCPTPQSGPCPPGVPRRQTPRRADRAGGKRGRQRPRRAELEATRAPVSHGLQRRAGRAPERPLYAWPRIPQTERRASALGCGQARLLRGPSQSFWGRKGPSSRAEHPRDHARTSQGIKGPRPQSRPAPPAAGSFHGRGRWGTEGYRRDAFCFC